MCLVLSVLLGFTGPREIFAGGGQWTLTGWNNLGMHCMDDDYSVFSILPPYNTVCAQLIDPQGHLISTSSGIGLTFEAMADPLGSINTTSADKSNFWDFAQLLFGLGSALPMDIGLAGSNMPGVGNVPQPMSFDAGLKWFSATGIPITPLDDYGVTNSYPMMKLVARTTSGRLLATAKVVLPVSTEVDCRGCHASGTVDAAKPLAGWIYNADGKRDHRLNILRLHDEKQSGNATYSAALTANGYRSSGLLDTVLLDAKPILCATCHSSEALGTGGYTGVRSLTAAVHGHHASVISPRSGMTLEATANRASCYECHPGSTTRCLRGAMGSAVALDGTLAMQCQSCHGSMSEVGALTRTGWLDEPNCQSCHTGSAISNNGQIRYTSVFDSPGHPRAAVNQLFATTPNSPAPGKSLYRFSTGHGGLHCEACHGSTHAEFPASGPNDNIYSQSLQNHSGVLSDCLTCHASEPRTVTGGPHGMHPLGQDWVNGHGDLAYYTGLEQCTVCHGSDYRGTVLSRAQGNRAYSTENFGVKRFWKGSQIGCFACHNGPSGEDEIKGPAPASVIGRLSLVTTREAAKNLVLTGKSAGLPMTFRIVSQPAHGTVGLSGRTATYFPDPTYVGPDSFTYAAWNGFVDSNLGAVNVRVVGSVNSVPDFSPPALKNISPANLAAVSAQGFVLSGNARDNQGVDLVEFRIGLGPWQAANGTTHWSATITGLSAGRTDFQIRATDRGGNHSKTARRTYILR